MTAWRAFLIVVGVSVLVGGALVLRLVIDAASRRQTWEDTPEGQAERRKAEAYRTESDEASKLFRRMGKPQPRDWLASHHEPGQLAREYARDSYTRKTAERHTIYLQPLGELSSLHRRCVDQMGRCAKAFFDCRAEVLRAVPLPEGAYNAGRGQADGRKLMEFLGQRVPENAVVLLGVTGTDLYREGMNFVFGLGNRSARTCLCSLFRYGNDYPTLLRRALKVMNHEVGHAFSLPHCIFYHCLMNGSGSLPESDRRPIHYCPVCLEKLRLAVGFDPAKRLKALGTFYRSVGFHDDARFVERRLAFVPQREQGKGRD